MIDYADMMCAPVDAHALTDDMSAWAQTVKGIAQVSHPHHGSSIDDFMRDEAKLHAALNTPEILAAVNCVKGIGDINSTAKGSAARYNAGKPPIEYIPVWMVVRSYDRLLDIVCHTDEQLEAHEALEHLAWWQQYPEETDHLYRAMNALGDCWDECAYVFGYGAKKYAPENWCKGMKWSVPLASATRHVIKMLRGETHDSESGLPHAGHVYCNLVMLLYYVDKYPELNDIPQAFLGDLDPCDQPWQGDFS